MSIKLMSLVWEIELPPGEKLVLLALADQANDEGRQCWPSVETIGKRSGQGERTVRRALQSLKEKGHLTLNHRDGTSTQYHVHPCHPDTPANSTPLPIETETPANLAPTPANLAPKPSLKHQEPSDEKQTRAAKRAIPDGWVPAEFGLGTKSREIVDDWSPGELAEHLEHFTAHHRGRGSLFKDWQDAWSTWVLNSKKFRSNRDGHGSQNGGRPAPRDYGPRDTRDGFKRAIDRQLALDDPDEPTREDRRRDAGVAGGSGYRKPPMPVAVR